MPSSRAHVVWTDRFFDYDFGPYHPFSERSRGLAAHLLESVTSASHPGVLGWSHTVEVASRPTLESFHQADYLEFVKQASGISREVSLDGGDTPAFRGCYDAAARIVQGAVDALDYTLEHRRPAFHPGGGLHHAHPDRASGFCIFNDVAIAVGRAVRSGHRVAYIDIDAHHGDGVMYGFYESGKVLDIDFHQDGRTLFPGTGFPHEVGRGDAPASKRTCRSRRARATRRCFRSSIASSPFCYAGSVRRSSSSSTGSTATTVTSSRIFSTLPPPTPRSTERSWR